MSVKIQPDAKITVIQTCANCKGEGVVGMTISCTACGHTFSQAELEAENTLSPLDNEKQSCGCSMKYRREYADFCDECDGGGVQHLFVTLSELAEALAAPMAAALAKKVAIHTPSHIL